MSGVAAHSAAVLRSRPTQRVEVQTHPGGQELVAAKGVSPVEALAELTQGHLERWREAAARVERA